MLYIQVDACVLHHCVALTAVSLKYVCHMTCSIRIMEEYVIKHSEIEGHFQYFQDRKSLWDIIKNSEKLSQLLVQLESQYSQLKREYKKKEGG